jgi:hypothetical protein
MIFVTLNVISMAISYETETEKYTTILKFINLVFTTFFILEALLKLLTQGPKNYFYKGWN